MHGLLGNTIDQVAEKVSYEILMEYIPADVYKKCPEDFFTN